MSISATLTNDADYCFAWSEGGATLTLGSVGFSPRNILARFTIPIPANVVIASAFLTLRITTAPAALQTPKVRC